MGLGVLIGGLAHGIPITIATIALPRDRSRQCDDEAIAECAVASAPDAIGGIIVFGLLVLFVALVCATCGALLVGHSFRSNQPDARTEHGLDSEASNDWATSRFAQMTIGTALLTPAVWLLASFVKSM